MKNKFFLSLLTLIIILFSGCRIDNVLYEFGFADYKNWKTIEISNLGTIKIPDNWIKKEYNDLFYFCDKNDDSKIYLFQSKSNVGVMSDENYEKGIIESNVISPEFQALSESSYETLYSDCIFSVTSVRTGDKENDMRCIKILYTTLYVYDNNVEDDTLYKIAYSLEKNSNVEYKGYH